MGEPVKPAEQGEAPVLAGELDREGRRVSPLAWVPTVNFAQGFQYAIVIQLFAIIFKTMGVPNGLTVFWASLLGLPWTLKPLWGPLVDRYGAKREWTVWMQGVICLALLGVGASLQLPAFFSFCVFFLFIVAFASATHDIACDGFYMLALNEKQQAFFVGFRSTAFRVAMIAANALLVALAGWVLVQTGPAPVDVRLTAREGAGGGAHVWVASTGAPGGDAGYGLAVATGEAPTSFTVALTAAPPPGEIAVVTVRLEEQGTPLKRVFAPDGAKGITVDVERMEFTADNWSEPRVVTPQVAAKGSAGDAVVYRVAAGNVALSWSIVMFACAAVYALLFVLHRWVMPRPHADVVDTAERPPFLLPLAALFVVCFLPYALGKGLLDATELLRESAQSWTVGAGATGTSLKAFELGFKAAGLMLVGLFFVVVLRHRYLSAVAGEFFDGMSRVSRIEFADVFRTFFAKPGMAVTLAFLLTFRLGEAQLAQVKNIFLLDERQVGGLALSLGQMAFTNGVVYLFALTAGGILGGLAIAQFGLRRVIWPMVAAMHLPNLLYVWLAYKLPDTLGMVNWVVGIESFGYGFGFAAYLLVMILAAQGPYRTSHYALCTGFMALGVMVPGLWSGFLQEVVGYRVFLWLVVAFSLPGMVFIPFLRIDPDFGRRAAATAK